MTRAVFLDRDGVLNRAPVVAGRPRPPASAAGLEVLPGVAPALERLRRAGFLLVVATNQPDVGRGSLGLADAEAVNARLLAELPALAEVRVCYDGGDGSPRRKPNPGMLLEAAGAHALDLAASFMVGDRWRDVEAGRRAGCRTVFLDLGYDEPRPDPPADHTADGLPAAADWILAQAQR